MWDTTATRSPGPIAEPVEPGRLGPGPVGQLGEGQWRPRLGRLVGLVDEGDPLRVGRRGAVEERPDVEVRSAWLPPGRRSAPPSKQTPGGRGQPGGPGTVGSLRWGDDRRHVSPSAPTRPTSPPTPCGTAGAEVVGLADGPDSLVWLDPGDVDGPGRLAGRGAGRPVGAAPLRRGRAGGRGRPARRPSGPGPAPRAPTPSRWPSTRWPWRWPACATCRPGSVARSWGIPAGTSLYDRTVTIVGGGGIATSLLEQLAPFRVEATVVRRRPDPVPGAARVLPVDRLHEALGRRAGGRAGPGADARRRPASSGRPSSTAMADVGLAGQRRPGPPRRHRRAGRGPRRRGHRRARPSTSPTPSRCPTGTRCGTSRTASSPRTRPTPSRW